MPMQTEVLIDPPYQLLNSDLESFRNIFTNATIFRQLLLQKRILRPVNHLLIEAIWPCEKGCDIFHPHRPFSFFVRTDTGAKARGKGCMLANM